MMTGNMFHCLKPYYSYLRGKLSSFKAGSTVQVIKMFAVLCVLKIAN